jgi:MraZ protein
MQINTKASYIGTFEHSFDAKGRITVPAEWRQENYERSLHIFPSREGCLKIYPESWLSRKQEEMSSRKLDDPHRKQLEALTGAAQLARWDQPGRIIIREKLRAGARLKKEVVLVGCADHFEIWDRAGREEQPERSVNLEEVAAALGL